MACCRSGNPAAEQRGAHSPPAGPCGPGGPAFPTGPGGPTGPAYMEQLRQGKRQGRHQFPAVTPVYSSLHCARRRVQQNTVWCAVRASNVLASRIPGLPCAPTGPAAPGPPIGPCFDMMLTQARQGKTAAGRVGNYWRCVQCCAHLQGQCLSAGRPALSHLTFKPLRALRTGRPYCVRHGRKRERYRQQAATSECTWGSFLQRK